MPPIQVTPNAFSQLVADASQGATDGVNCELEQERILEVLPAMRMLVAELIMVTDVALEVM